MAIPSVSHFSFASKSLQNDIPAEILVNIFKHLSFNDLKRLQFLCTLFNQIVTDSYKALANSLGYHGENDKTTFLKVFSHQISHAVEKQSLDKKFQHAASLPSFEFHSSSRESQIRLSSQPSSREPFALCHSLLETINLSRKQKNTSLVAYKTFNVFCECRLSRRGKSFTLSFKTLHSYGAYAYLHAFFKEVRLIRYNLPSAVPERKYSVDKFISYLSQESGNQLLEVFCYLTFDRIVQIPKVLSLLWDLLSKRGNFPNLQLDQGTKCLARTLLYMEIDQTTHLEIRDIYYAFLIAYGADYTLFDSLGNPFFYTVCAFGLKRTARCIVELNPKLVTDDPNPLVFVVKAQNEELTHLFLDLGAKADIADEYGTTLLMRAAKLPNFSIFERVFKATNSNSSESNKLGNNALNYALKKVSSAKEMEICFKKIRMLLNAGYKADHLNAKQSSLLHLAAERGLTEIALFFIDQGAPVDTENKEGETPLLLASKAACFELASALIDKKARPAHTDRAGNTPLIHAVRKSATNLVELLLGEESLAKHLDHANRLGETALWLATKGEFYSIILMLLKAGCDPHQPAVSGKTPYELARNSKHLKTVLKLFDKHLKKRNSISHTSRS